METLILVVIRKTEHFESAEFLELIPSTPIGGNSNYQPLYSVLKGLQNLSKVRRHNKVCYSFGKVDLGSSWTWLIII